MTDTREEAVSIVAVRPIAPLMDGADDMPNEMNKFIKIDTQSTNGIYNFCFPGVSDAVASIYWDILITMERRFPIDDYFTNPELRQIVKAIDNHDYVNDVHSDTDVGWHGLLIDRGILSFLLFSPSNSLSGKN